MIFSLFYYSVNNPNSYRNVSEKWVPELRHFCPRVPIILVATKTDLRYDARVARELAEHGESTVSVIQGQALARKIQVSLFSDSILIRKLK